MEELRRCRRRGDGGGEDWAWRRIEEEVKVVVIGHVYKVRSKLKIL
jgi:hypothetical protein